jgi:Zn-finger nucleic acid-binding protein
MHCIRCGGAMDKRAERGVLLDHCRPCNGVWLDAGELEALELGVARSAEELEAARHAESTRESARAVETIGLCPRCQRPLETRGLQGVEIDQCRACGGIYFDHGEIASVLARGRGILERWKRR